MKCSGEGGGGGGGGGGDRGVYWKVCVLWPIFDIMDFFQTEIKLNFVKQLRTKLSEKSLNRRFDVTMTSLPSDKDKLKTDLRYTYFNYFMIHVSSLAYSAL